MKIQCVDKKISDILNGGYYKIPRFQRPYSWQREQIDEFWNDTVAVKQADYFIGSTVVFDLQDGTFGIVDGQQRLTTITMLLCSIRNALDVLGYRELAEGIHNVIEKRDINNNLQYILQTETSYPYLQEHIQKYGNPSSEGKGGLEEENLELGFQLLNSYVESTINSIREDPSISEDDKPETIKDRLLEIRDKILGLSIIFISIDNEDDAYIAFETLNTRGFDLRTRDLVKNHLTRLLKAKNKNVDIAKDKWNNIVEVIESSANDIDMDSFIHHFWLSRYEYTSLRKLFKLMKKQVNQSNAEPFLDDLSTDAITYREINETSHRRWDKQDLEIRKSLDALILFRVQQQLPMVLSVIREYKVGRLAKRQVVNILRAIENFHFVFTAVTSQRSSGGISSMYASSARRLFEAQTKDQKNYVIDELKTKLQQKLPTYKEFEASFELIVYSDIFTKQKRLVQYILGKINDYTSPGIAVDYEQMTIEHLKPQSIAEPGIEQWEVARLGNLVLTTQALNIKLAAKPFLKKVELLRSESQIRLDEIIGSSKQWNSKQINERTKWMSNVSYNQIWKI